MTAFKPQPEVHCSGPVHSLRTYALVQLSTRKRDIMAFSGLVYEDDKVSYPDQMLRYVNDDGAVATWHFRPEVHQKGCYTQA